MLGDTLTEVVLRDNVDGKLAFTYLDIGVAAGRLEQATLYLLARIVLVVKDSELGVSTLTMEVKAVALAVEVKIDTVLHQLTDAVRRLTDGHFHHLAVADAITGNKGVVYVLVERVAVVHHSGDTPLGIARATLGSIALGEHYHLAIRGHFQGKGETGNAGSYHEKINFVAHFLVYFEKFEYYRIVFVVA